MHPSRIFSALSVLFLISVAIGQIFPLKTGLLFYTIVAFSISVFLFWKKKGPRYLLLTLLFFALGLYRGMAQEQIRVEPGKQIKATVMVTDEPKVSGKSQSMAVRVVGTDNNLLITTTQFPAYHFGDVLAVSGITGSLDSELASYYRAQNILTTINFPKISSSNAKFSFLDKTYLSIRKPLINFRLLLQGRVTRLFPEPQAGLLSGILFGYKADLSSAFLSDLSRTGTIHIIALSGYNITIVAAAFRILFQNKDKNLAFWLPVAGIVAFVFATAFSASVVRASIMGILLLLAKRTGRQSDALVSVLFASALMVFLNPAILLYDLGFQLSFAAVCGIIFLAPKIERFFVLFGPTLGPIFATTLAAQLLTWPVTSFWFGNVSVIAPIVNMFILPFIPYLMLAGIINVLISFVWYWPSQILAILPWAMLTYFHKIISLFSASKYAALSYKTTSLAVIIGYYLIIFDLIMILKRKKNLEPELA